MWFCSPLDFTLCRWKIRPWCICVCMCVCVCAGGGGVVEYDGCCYSLRFLPPSPHRNFHNKETGAGVTAALNKAARHVGTAARRRHCSASETGTSLPLLICLSIASSSRLVFLSARAPRILNRFFLFYITKKNALCFLLPLTFSFCFFPFFSFICIFCLVFFFFFSFFHPPPPLLLRLSLSACLLPNEALRIKCLKDCRHFRRFGRHATVHSSLRCSSDDCQTCEEHFEAGVCVGVEGREKKAKVLILHTTTTPLPPSLLCKRNKSLVNCASSPASRRDARAA